MINGLKNFMIFLFALTAVCKASNASERSDDHNRIYILIGYPGAGKGTFAQCLQSDGYIHLSTGDKLREELNKQSAIGVKYKNEILTGGVIPSAVLQDIVEKNTLQVFQNKEKLIIDGYPRTIEQVKLFELFLEAHAIKNVYRVFLEVNPEVALDRIMQRRTCPQCNKIYNLIHCPPENTVCNICKVDLFHRPSDNYKDTKKRIDSYSTRLQEITSYYASKDLLYTINVNDSLNNCISNFLKYK